MDTMKWLEKQATWIHPASEVNSFEEAKSLLLETPEDATMGELSKAEQAIKFLSLHYNVPSERLAFPVAYKEVKDFVVDYFKKKFLTAEKKGWTRWIAKRMLKYLSPLDENLAASLKGNVDKRFDDFADQCILRDWQKETGIKLLSKSDFPSYLERIRGEAKKHNDYDIPTENVLLNLIAKDIAFNRQDVDYTENELFSLISEITKFSSGFPRYLMMEICAEDDVSVFYAKESSNINLARSLFVFLLSLKGEFGEEEARLHDAPRYLHTFSQQTKQPNLDIIKYLVDRKKDTKKDTKNDDWFFDSYIGHSLVIAAENIKPEQTREYVQLLDYVDKSSISRKQIEEKNNFLLYRIENNEQLNEEQKKEILNSINFYFNTGSLIDEMKKSGNRDPKEIKSLLFHKNPIIRERIIMEILPLEFQSLNKKLSYMPLFEKLPDETKVVFIDALGAMIPQGYLMQFIVRESNEVSQKAIEAMDKIGLGSLVPKREKLLQKRMHYRKENQPLMQTPSGPQFETETEI